MMQVSGMVVGGDRPGNALAMGDALACSGQTAQAVEQYRWAANGYCSRGETHNALVVYQRILHLDPNCFDVHLRAADLQQQLGRRPEAAAAYDLVGRAYMRAGWAREAIKIYQLAADADPSIVARRVRLAEVCSAEGMTTEAVRHFQRALTMLRSAGDDDYIRVAQRLLFHEPDDTGALRAVAAGYLERRDVRRAVRSLHRLLHLCPADVTGLELMGEAFGMLGKMEQAGRVMLLLGRDLMARGADGHSEAMRVFQRGLHWDPLNPELQTAVGDLGGDFEELGPADLEFADLDEIELQPMALVDSLQISNLDITVDAGPRLTPRMESTEVLDISDFVDDAVLRPEKTMVISDQEIAALA